MGEWRAKEGGRAEGVEQRAREGGRVEGGQRGRLKALVSCLGKRKILRRKFAPEDKIHSDW